MMEIPAVVLLTLGLLIGVALLIQLLIAIVLCVTAKRFDIRTRDAMEQVRIKGVQLFQAEGARLTSFKKHIDELRDGTLAATNDIDQRLNKLERRRRLKAKPLSVKKPAKKRTHKKKTPRK